MNNMKIEINDTQPLDEVVSTLESKGYVKSETFTGVDSVIITAFSNGEFTDWTQNTLKGMYETTLAELKEMK